MEVEDVFQSFSTERIRSKIHIREAAPVTQRRLDYNAPLMSVRRFADMGAQGRSMVWKLSGELSKEPLSVPGAVPFTWEHSPGQPKQPEPSAAGESASMSRAAAPKLPPKPPQSPPRSPSSPSPPSTPSPPSARRASPASPTIPSPPRRASQPLPNARRTAPASPSLVSPQSLRPRFIRSNSSTLYAPPPPPPPPPPSIHTPFKITRRSTPPPKSSSPYPPPVPPASSKASFSTAHDRVKAFRLVDPTEDLLRALHARREKLDALEMQSETTELVNETPKPDAICDQPIIGVAETSCGVVDAIVQRFLADHPDASAKEESFKGHDGESQQGGDVGILNAVDCSALDCGGSNTDMDVDVVRNHKHIHSHESNDIPLQEDEPALQVCANEAADEEEEEQRPVFLDQEVQRPVLLDRTHLWVYEDGESEATGTDTAPQHPSTTEAVETQPEVGLKQVILIKKQQNKRRSSSSIAILDSCRVESFRMIKSTLVQLCRKAVVASVRALGKAKRRVTPSHCNSRSLDVVVHRHASGVLNRSISNFNEQPEPVVRDVEVVPQERLSQSEQVEMHHVYDYMQVETREGTPISSPKSQGKLDSKDTISSPSLHVPLNTAASLDLQETIETTSTSLPSIPSSNMDELNMEKSSDLQPSTEQGVTDEPRPFSVRHVYSKSLGGDESNEFYDASSRFGSQNSTPVRINSARSMSRDWGHSDDFLDATSTPFESPRTSMSENRYSSSPSVALKRGSNNRPTSKLSKRIGKALWVDTREIDASEKRCSTSMKSFYSGELFTASNAEGSSALNEEPILATRKKWVSADQASTSTSQARRQSKRPLSSLRNSKNAIAVTPVFPSKCQKNRMIGSASGLPRQILGEDMKDMGWPLGISGYPPKACAKKDDKAESKMTKKGLSGGNVVPSPPLPPTPAGGSWLRKAITSNTQNQAPSRLAGLHAAARPAPKENSSSPTPNSPNQKWEAIVKGSHVQPGHLRFSEELHHHPPNSSSNKYFIS